jgi:hypothetical protein
MPFAVGFFNILGISIFIGLVLLILAAWRKDRRGRSQRAPDILSLKLDIGPDEEILSSISERCRYGRFPFLFG